MLTSEEINALIRELKKNREDMLPKCKLKIASQYENFLGSVGVTTDALTRDGKWSGGGNGDSLGTIYSLPLDFPEVTEGWVVVPVDNNGYVWVENRGYDWFSAPVNVRSFSRKVSHFGGYIFRSQKTSLEFLSQALLGFEGSGDLSEHIKAWVKPATPVALRFWSTDVAYACTLGFKPWNADES